MRERGRESEGEGGDTCKYEVESKGGCGGRGWRERVEGEGGGGGC